MNLCLKCAKLIIRRCADRGLITYPVDAPVKVRGRSSRSPKSSEQREYQRLAMARLRAERRGLDTSVYPKRQRGPKSDRAKKRR